MKKKILICGATGFIGRNLIEDLSKNKNNKIYATFNKRKKQNLKNVTWVKGDLRNDDFSKRITKNIDIVIQAAATSSGSKDVVLRPYLHVTDNAVMNAYLFRNSYLNKVKHVIFFSCTTMYKSSKKPVKENEFNSIKDIVPKYFGCGTTKVYNEAMCEFFSRIGETKFTVIRHSNVYGPYDKYDLERSHVFGATITKVMKAKDEVIVWGKGTEERDLVHVDDLVNFVKLSIAKQKKKFRLLNCGAGYSISIGNLVKKIIKISNKKLKIKYDLTKPTIPFVLSVNCNIAKKELDWKPKISLDEGIKSTIAWWKENI